MRAIFLILVLLITSSCSKNDNEFLPIEITPTLISKGYFFNSNYNPTRHNLIFNDSDEWEDFIANIWLVNPVPSEANVDFNTYQVIAVIDEPRPNGGHSIDIISITENAENIIVVVDKLLNGDATTIPTRPYHFVKIPISNKEITFE